MTDIITGGFTIQAGGSVGYIHIFTGASTYFSGKKPAAGLYAQVTGTGSPATSMNATYVSTYAKAPGRLESSGTVASVTPYGFTLDVDATHPAVPIVLDSTTALSGSAIGSGAPVKVAGVGANYRTITASTISASGGGTPTPAPIAMRHVLTGDLLGGVDGGTHSIAWSQATPYLTWAQTSPTDANGIHAAGMKTQYYLDPNRLSVGDTIYPTNDEAAFAHDCHNNRVYDTYNGGLVQYVGQIGGPDLQKIFDNYIKEVAADSHIDAIFEDDAGALTAYMPYWPFSGTPCGYTNASWIADGVSLNQSSSLPIIFNGLSGLNGHNVSLSVGLLKSSNTIGGTYEGCFTSNDEPKMNGWEWTAIENSALQVTAQNKLFFCMEKNTNPGASHTDERIYALASFLLTYVPAESVLWEEFATTSGLHVEPESGLVPQSPLIGSPTSVASLQQSGGTYGRQYANCYYRGTYVGACAVVVNPDPSYAHPFPYSRYHHTLVLGGGGVLEGGTASFAGPAPPTTLAPEEAAIVF